MFIHLFYLLIHIFVKEIIHEAIFVQCIIAVTIHTLPSSVRGELKSYQVTVIKGGPHITFYIDKQNKLPGQVYTLSH